MNRNNRGFTLVELLVVISIISLLSSVVLASLRSARTRAQDTKIVSELRQIQTSMEIYYNENGRYPLTGPNTYYCIGNTNCLVGNVPYATQLSSIAPTFTYKPSSSYLTSSNNRGFVYYQPATGAPEIMFATDKTGALRQTVGVWVTTLGS